MLCLRLGAMLSFDLVLRLDTDPIRAARGGFGFHF